MPPVKQIYQFKITLQGIKPPIWRRIQVPSTFSFYDLHIAIQDAMGWHDYHLHEFRIRPKTGETLVFGIPSDDGSFMLVDERMRAGWRHKISRYQDIIPSSFMYTYDFGDNWNHKVEFEEIKPAEPGVTYPRCIKGKRACPPEDSGGAWRYPDLLEILADSQHPEHQDTVQWIEAQKGDIFDPEHFDSVEVVFDNPKERLKALRE